jgi:hypothetical protein
MPSDVPRDTTTEGSKGCNEAALTPLTAQCEPAEIREGLECRVVEVHNLRREAPKPKGDRWILIEKRDHRYFITGQSNGRPIDASAASAGFNTPDEAIRAAETWADLLEVPILYVREDQ